MLVISHCLTLLLGGNIELSLVANVPIVLLSQYVGAERLFYVYEQVFNSDNVDNRFGAASSGFNFVWPLFISIVLSLFGVLIQCIWPKSKQCATTILRHLSIFYVLVVLIISYSYLFVMFGYSIIMQFDQNLEQNDSSYVMESLKAISVSAHSLANFVAFAYCRLIRSLLFRSIFLDIQWQSSDSSLDTSWRKY